MSGSGGYAVGIISQVGSQQDGVFEIVGIPYSPQRCFECVDDIAGGADLVAGFFLVFAGVDDPLKPLTVYIFS